MKRIRWVFCFRSRGVFQTLRSNPLFGGIFSVTILLGVILIGVAAFDLGRVKEQVASSAHTLSLALMDYVERTFQETDRTLQAIGQQAQADSNNTRNDGFALPPYIRGAVYASTNYQRVKTFGALSERDVNLILRYRAARDLKTSTLAALPDQRPSLPEDRGRGHSDTMNIASIDVFREESAQEIHSQSLTLGALEISSPLRMGNLDAVQNEEHLGEWGLLVSRPVLSRNGEPLGVVVAVLDPNNWGGFYRALDMPEGSVMVIALKDGTVISHVPYRTDGAVGWLARSSLFRDELPRRREGVYWSQNDELETSEEVQKAAFWGGALADDDFVYGYSALSDYPLLTVVGVSAQDALDGWWARALTLVFVGCAALATLVILARQLSVYLRSLRQSEQRYRAAEMHLSHAQSLAHIGSWEWGLRDNHMWWSTELLRICGVLGNSKGGSQPSYEFFLTMVHPEDRARVAITIGKALEDGQAFALDYRIRLSDGVVRHLHHEGQCVLDEDASVERMDCVIQDVTESAVLQAQLAQAAKLSTLGEMASGMAHELSQPLNIIKMSVEGAQFELEAATALQNGPDNALTQSGVEALSGQIKTALDVVTTQADRMGQTLEYIRIFSQKDPAPVDIFDGGAAVSVAGQVLQGQCSEAGVDLSIDLPGLRVPLQGRAVQLEQVLVNLLSNARDAVIARQREGNGHHGKIWLIGRVLGREFQILVCDNGSGIPSDLSSRLFEPFFTTKGIGQGSGLGLSVAYGIISAMDGSLSASNRDNGGACFEIRLPIQLGKDLQGSGLSAPTPWPFEALPAPPNHTEANQACPCPLLLVEDGDYQGSELRSTLTAQGFDVLSVLEAEACTALRDRAVSLVMLNLEQLSPDEALEDGRRFLHMVRRIDPMVLVVVMLAANCCSPAQAQQLEADDPAAYALQVSQKGDELHTILGRLIHGEAPL